MFLDREDHLKHLNEQYEKKEFYAVSLYSAPKMGKTTWLREFCKGKRFIYFRAAKTTSQENFLALKEEALRLFGEDKKLYDAKRFAEIFRALARLSRQNQLVLILDDYQQLVEENRRLSTLIRSYREKEWKDSGLFVILCKPADWYEKEAESEENKIVLQPFSFFETCQLFSMYSVEEQIELYGITGGVPGFLSDFDTTKSVLENLKILFFSHRGEFFKIPERFLRLAESPRMSYCVMSALKNRHCKLHEISEMTGFTPSMVSTVLGNLEELGVVEKLVPVTEKQSSRRARYRICDGVLRFWYTFVEDCANRIEMGEGSIVFEEEIRSKLDAYFTGTFEDICRQFLQLLLKYKEAPFAYEHVGNWWGQHPTKKRTEYVPIAAADENNILLGNCFWSDEWIDLDGLLQLQKHASLFPHSTKWYVLFAKSDFVMGMSMMYGDIVRVYTLKDMCEYAKEKLATS